MNLPAFCSPRVAQLLNFLSSLWSHPSFSLEKLNPRVHAPFGASFLPSSQQEATSLGSQLNFLSKVRLKEVREDPVFLCPSLGHLSQISVHLSLSLLPSKPFSLMPSWTRTGPAAGGEQLPLLHVLLSWRPNGSSPFGWHAGDHQAPHSTLAGQGGCDKMTGR